VTRGVPATSDATIVILTAAHGDRIKAAAEEAGADLFSPPGATLVAEDPDGRIVGTAELAPSHGGGPRVRDPGDRARGFEHPTQGYVGLHIMYRAL
jgi:hypothetical protein